MSNSLNKPEDPEAVLYIPTRHDAARLERQLRDLHHRDEAIESIDETLWAELAAQIAKQRDDEDE